MDSAVIDDLIKRALERVARFYDLRKVGEVGYLGFRRSTDLGRLLSCIEPLIDRGLLVPGKSLFLDMGAADGRVNVLFSYLVGVSVGIEVDEWTLDESGALRWELNMRLREDDLPAPPENIFLFNGDSTDDALHNTVKMETGIAFDQFDLFYTYLTMYEEFADLIRRRAKSGALFMVYGLDRIQPLLRGLRLLSRGRPLEGILALYQKP